MAARSRLRQGESPPGEMNASPTGVLGPVIVQPNFVDHLSGEHHVEKYHGVVKVIGEAGTVERGPANRRKGKPS